MKCTFMIGNGFDKHIGLETGYDQFLRWYLKQPSASKNIQNYKEDLLRNPTSPWWSDAEVAMGQYAGNFKPEEMDVYYEVIRDFKIKLVDYLREQEARCDFSDTKAISDCMNDFFLNFHRDILPASSVQPFLSDFHDVAFDFLSFNYTNVLRNILTITRETNPQNILWTTKPDSTDATPFGVLGDIMSIHGDLTSRIIMGVDDTNQIALPPSDISLKMHRTLIKPEINRLLGRSEAEKAERIINESDLIAIFGLKLGDTDATWRSILANWLRDDDHTIILFGHDNLNNIHPQMPEDLLNYVVEKQLSFLKKIIPWQTDEELLASRNQVLVINQTKHLKISIVH